MKQLLTIIFTLFVLTSCGQKINNKTSNTYSRIIIGRESVTESVDTPHVAAGVFIGKSIANETKDDQYPFFPIIRPKLTVKVKEYYDLFVQGDNGASLYIDGSGKMVITDSLSAINSLLFVISQQIKR